MPGPTHRNTSSNGSYASNNEVFIHKACAHRLPDTLPAPLPPGRDLLISQVVFVSWQLCYAMCRSVLNSSKWCHTD